MLERRLEELGEKDVATIEYPPLPATADSETNLKSDPLDAPVSATSTMPLLSASSGLVALPTTVMSTATPDVAVAVVVPAAASAAAAPSTDGSVSSQDVALQLPH